MFKLTQAYDDLVAIRGALAVADGMVSETTKRELHAVLRFTEGRVYVALQAVSEEDREEVIEGLDDLYGRGARAELEGYL